jgi:hypothetical protein
MENFFRLSRLEIGGLIVVVTVMSATLLVLILNLVPPNLFSRPSVGPDNRSGSAPANPGGIHSGVIRLRDQVDGKCRRLQFDNDRGTLREIAPDDCRVDVFSGPNSTQNRINAVRDSFSKK